MKTSLMVLVVLAALGARVFADTVSWEYMVSEGIRIQIPGGWVRIPQDVLNEDSRLSQENVPASIRMTMDAGFQPSANETWMEMPYVLIQLKTDRVSEQELKNLAGMGQRLKTEICRIDPCLASSLEISTPWYEPAANVVWLTMTYSTEMQIVMGLKLTDQGTVMTALYCEDADVEQYRPILQKMVRSIRLREGLEYKERSVPPVSENVMKAALIPLILAIGAWVRSRWKRAFSGALQQVDHSKDSQDQRQG